MGKKKKKQNTGKKKEAGAPPEKKVILFLSRSSRKSEESYLCPDGKTVEGVQTNEAPVKYLLRKYRGEITKVLCIVSSACTEPVKVEEYKDPETGQWNSTWEYFQRKIQDFCAEEGLLIPEKFLEKIDFREDGGSDTEAALVRDVSGKLNPGDEILLETTGGFRNSVMLLLLLSRILSYTGHPTVCAVYSFLDSSKPKEDKQGKNEVFDISNLTELFDLIGGMQELTSFGNIRTLRKYYKGRPHDSKIDALLIATEKLLDTIALCRTDQLPERMKEFNQAMDAAKNCGDPLLPQLLPAFRLKYGEEMDIPAVIRWCVESDMIQQALTIYKENIPSYLFCHGHVLKVRPEVKLPKDKPADRRAKEAYFRSFIASFFKNGLEASRKNWQDWRETRYSDYEIICKDYEYETVRCIVLDYNYILLLRNMTNHASDTVEETKQERAEKLNALFPEWYCLPGNTTAKDVKAAILRGLENMKKTI